MLNSRNLKPSPDQLDNPSSIRQYNSRSNLSKHVCIANRCPHHAGPVASKSVFFSTAPHPSPSTPPPDALVGVRIYHQHRLPKEDRVFAIVLDKEMGLLRLWLSAGYDLSAASKEQSSLVRRKVALPSRPVPLIYLPPTVSAPSNANCKQTEREKKQAKVMLGTVLRYPVHSD